MNRYYYTDLTRLPETADYPPPPYEKPPRQYRDTWFSGLVETKQSIQDRIEYEIFCSGFRTGYATRIKNNP